MSSTPRSLHELGGFLRAHSAEFRDAVHRDFFVRELQARPLFPLAAEAAHTDLAAALAWVCERSMSYGSLPREVADRLSNLGRDHRRHGFPPSAYDDFAAALLAGLRSFDLDEGLVDTARGIVTQTCATMADAAHTADVEGTPPAYSATVDRVEHPNRDTAIVRVNTSYPLDFQPGQSIPVTTPHTPGEWRQLTPAAPSDPTGQLTFHIVSAGRASRMMAHARSGDRWIMGRPRGEFVQFPAVRLVFLCFGTGWAAVKPYLISLVDALSGGDVPAELSVCVYHLTDSPGAHYDTHFQRNLAAVAPWISITHLVKESKDHVLLNPEPGAAVDYYPTSDAAASALAGARLGSNFVLVGPATDVGTARARLIDAGVKPSRIEAHPWEQRGYWPEI